MEKINAFSLSFASAGGITSFFIGEWDLPLKLLLAVIVIDYISGVFAAATAGKLRSSLGFKGILKKLFIVIMVCVGHMLDTILNMDGLFRQAVIFFYFANEIISVLENAGVIGLPIPEKIYQAIAILKEKEDRK